MDKVNLNKITIGDLNDIYKKLAALNGKQSIPLNIQLSKELYNYFSANSTEAYSEGLFHYLEQAQPFTTRNAVVQLINGNANINLQHNSHLRCLYSYATQFRIIGVPVYLVVVNLPSSANPAFWDVTKKFAYKNYINDFIGQNFAFNPYDDISILFDSDQKDLNLKNVVTTLKRFFKLSLSHSLQIMGLSGGGPNLLGSHGLEWLECIHADVLAARRSTLMCHMYDRTDFLKSHDLLTMSAEMTKAYLYKADPKSSHKIYQSLMIDPILFRNHNKNIAIDFSYKEKQFINQIIALPASSPKLLIAGPWLDKKWSSKVIDHRLNKAISYRDTIDKILPTIEDLYLIIIGARKTFVTENLTSFDSSKIVALHESDNFSGLLSQIKKYAQNVVATFTPNHGNGSTNSEVANSEIPSLFLKPNDSQAMLPDCAFEADIEAYLSKLSILLTSSRDRLNHLKDFTEAKVIHTQDSLHHVNSLL